MATSTSNYALTKPATSDPALISDINTNMDMVDTQLARVGFKSTDVASAATLALPAQGSVFDVTGAVTITAISARTAGEVIVLQFDDALILTHNGSSLKLVGGANLTTVAGDVLVFVSEGSGSWRQVAPLGRTPSTQAFSDAAVVGTSSVPALADHKHAMMAVPARVTVAGSDLAEHSTTSTSFTNVASIAVNLTALVPFLVVGAWRKTTGAAAGVQLGLTLNGTTVLSGYIVSGSTNAVDSGIFMAWVGPHTATYLGTGYFLTSQRAAAATPLTRGFDGDIPNATITTVTIRGVTNDALVTLAINNIYIYAFPTS